MQHVLPAEASAQRASASSAPGMDSAATSARPARANRRADTISSKHLEAELNRLEAELGR